MNFGNLIYNLPENHKKSVRNFEKINKKLINAKYSLSFNKCCLKENLLPIYTNINLHDRATREENITVEFRKKLIERQIDIKKNEHTSIENNLKEQLSELESILQNYDSNLKTNIMNKLNELSDMHNLTLVKPTWCTISRVLKKIAGFLITYIMLE